MMEKFLEPVRRSHLWKLANVHFDKLVIAGIIYFVVVMLGYTWKSWADPQIDFGRELYIPWQLSEGKVLYKDIFHIFGPFSQYFNAMLFKIFGVSWNVLIVANALLLIGFGCLLYRVMCQLSNRMVGTTCVMFFYLNFSFAHYYEIGNYNYIAPYAHEIVHGLYFIILAFYFVINKYHSLIIGIVLGLILLTKPEFILTGFALAVMHSYNLRALGKRQFYKCVFFLVIGALAPSLLFVFYFCVIGELDCVTGLEYTLQAIVMVVRFNPANNAFYQDVSGFANIWGNAFQQFRSLAMLGICVVGLYYCNEKKYSWNLYYRISASLLIVCAFLCFYDSMSIGSVFVSVSVLLLFGLNIKKDITGSDGISGLSIFCVMSIVILIKCILNVEIHHYGFVLAVFSSCCFVYFLIKNWDYFQCKNAQVLSIYSMLLLIGLSTSNFIKSWQMYSEKKFLLCGKNDALWTLSPDLYYIPDHMHLLQGWINCHMNSDSITIIPEGIMLNFINRIPTAAGVINYLPHEVDAFGEGLILKSLSINSPQYIVFIYRGLEEYNQGGFGEGEYGIEIMKWIIDNYDLYYDPYGNSGNTNASPCLAVFKLK